MARAVVLAACLTVGLCAVARAAEPPTARRAQARALYAPVQAFRLAIASRSAAVNASAEAWRKRNQECTDQVQQQFRDAVPATDADFGAVTRLLATVQLLDGEQEVVKLVRPQLATARRSFSRVRVDDRVLLRLARAEGGWAAFLLGLPDLDACSFYRAWGEVGWSRSRTPALVPGRTERQVVAARDALRAAQGPGLRRLRSWGLSARQVAAVRSFPLG
jgi:hypothetical protein